MQFTLTGRGLKFPGTLLLVSQCVVTVQRNGLGWLCFCGMSTTALPNQCQQVSGTDCENRNPSRRRLSQRVEILTISAGRSIHLWTDCRSIQQTLTFTWLDPGHSRVRGGFCNTAVEQNCFLSTLPSAKQAVIVTQLHILAFFEWPTKSWGRIWEVGTCIFARRTSMPSATHAPVWRKIWNSRLDELRLQDKRRWPSKRTAPTF